jgi:hypothetical protein
VLLVRVVVIIIIVIIDIIIDIGGVHILAILGIRRHSCRSGQLRCIRRVRLLQSGRRSGDFDICGLL